MAMSDLSASLLPAAQVTPVSPLGSVLPIPGCRKGLNPSPPGRVYSWSMEVPLSLVRYLLLQLLVL